MGDALKVLELGGYAAGYAGRLFVHQGADVVRIVSPPLEPAWASETAMALYLHANKRQIRSPDSELFAALAARADVLICEAATATAATELGYDTAAARTKVAITPYGMTGPKRDWQATNNVLLAAGGYTYIMGDPDRAPLSLPGHYLDFQAGALAYSAAMAMLWRGDDKNRAADIAKLETLMAMSQFTTVRYHCANEIRSRHGSDFYFVTPSQLFRCADGWVYVNIVPGFWDAFAVFLQRPELLVDERFETNDLRMQHREILHDLVAQALADVGVEELGARAAECRVPVGVVHGFDDVLNLDHLAVRDFWSAGWVKDTPVKVPGLSYRIDAAPRPQLRLDAAADSGTENIPW